MTRQYQYQIVDGTTNKIIVNSKLYKDVVKMEDASVKEAGKHPETCYCVQLVHGADVDYNLTKWIYEQKLKAEMDGSDDVIQNMTDDMCEYENRANAEVFVC